MTRSSAAALGNRAIGVSPLASSPSARYETTVPVDDCALPLSERRGGRKTIRRASDRSRGKSGAHPAPLALRAVPPGGASALGTARRRSYFACPQNVDRLHALTGRAASDQGFHAGDSAVQFHFAAYEEVARRGRQISVSDRCCFGTKAGLHFADVVEVGNAAALSPPARAPRTAKDRQRALRSPRVRQC